MNNTTPKRWTEKELGIYYRGVRERCNQILSEYKVKAPNRPYLNQIDRTN